MHRCTVDGEALRQYEYVPADIWLFAKNPFRSLVGPSAHARNLSNSCGDNRGAALLSAFGKAP